MGGPSTGLLDVAAELFHSSLSAETIPDRLVHRHKEVLRLSSVAASFGQGRPLYHSLEDIYWVAFVFRDVNPQEA